MRESSSCALVHCLAGISRSPTLAIAYIMRYLGLTTDEAYKYAILLSLAGFLSPGLCSRINIYVFSVLDMVFCKWSEEFMRYLDII